MKKYYLFNSLFLIVMVILLVFSIGPIYASDEIILSMDDLNQSNGNIFNRYMSNSSSKSGDDIVILYENESTNNIGSLGLMKKDFESGETVNERLDLLTTSGETPTDDLIEDIKNNPNVKAVDYDEEVFALDLNDKYYDNYQKEHFQQVNAIDSPTLGLNNLVKVAILDTGLNSQEEDIQGRFLLEGYNYIDNKKETEDDNGHGTAVSSIVSAITNNEIGIAGFSGTSNVKVIPYKVLGSDGSGGISKIVAAILDINKRNDIKILNLSLGVEKSSTVLKEAVEEAYQNGKIVLAASGNYGDDHLMYPARYDQVISVGAVNNNNSRCTEIEWGEGFGSNYGEGLDFVAPGNNIAVILGNGGYGFSSGTSNATPIATALVALMLEENPELTFNEIINELKGQAKDLGPQGYDTEYGNGLIDFDNTINAVIQHRDKPVDSQTEILELKPTSLNMVINQVNSIQAITNSKNPIIWKSSNSNIVSVNNGIIRALRAGEAKISATISGKNISAETVITVANIDILSISAHSQDIGWKPAVNSLDIAGTTGMNKQLEAFAISLADPNISINSQVHVSNIGDMRIVGENEVVGTTGRSLGIEAVNLNLSGFNTQNYTLYYRTHVENYGWTNWTSNGNWSGTKGKNLQIEAIQIALVPRNTSAPNIKGDVNWTFMS